MNERIKELADQAWTLVSDEERSQGELYDARKQQERRDQVFAELIVRGCIDKIEENQFGDGEEFDRGCKSCSFAVRQHFGVEE